jgi:uncharacterized membrane protein
MKRLLVAWLAAVAVLAAMDAVWLGAVATTFYQQQIGHLMAPEPRLGVAVVFYLLYLVGVVIFAVKPALEAGSGRKALSLGSAFGFFAYMTYDLTNLATLRDWPAVVALVDIAWGMLVSAASAWAGYHAARRFGQSPPDRGPG